MKEVRINIERANSIMEQSKYLADRIDEIKVERPKKKKLIATRECGNCKYFDEYDANVHHMYDGRCRRYPQTVEQDKDDWCGEFAMAPEPKIFKEREEVTP